MECYVLLLVLICKCVFQKQTFKYASAAENEVRFAMYHKYDSLHPRPEISV
jgi:hypothetical protein